MLCRHPYSELCLTQSTKKFVSLGALRSVLSGEQNGIADGHKLNMFNLCRFVRNACMLVLVIDDRIYIFATEIFQSKSLAG